MAVRTRMRIILISYNPFFSPWAVGYPRKIEGPDTCQHWGQFKNMNVQNFIKSLRKKRNVHEQQLRKCEVQDTRDLLKSKIERLNMFIQEFGADAYDYRKEKKNKF